MNITRTLNDSCSVCGNTDLPIVMDLPRFPITGVYVAKREPERFPNMDQALLFCRECSHAQLQYVIDPNYLYDKTYTHRSSASPIATSGNDFFIGFLNTVVGGKTFERILEIGCNNLYLLKKIKDRGHRLLGVDPIWAGNDQKVDGNISVAGKFIENVDIQGELGGRPDLILAIHTFEHVHRPKEQLQKVVDAAAPGAVIMIEVPCFDSLLNAGRFDQVFHQHLQYFSLSSMLRMIQELGCGYLSHAFNYSYWRGTLLVAFRKGDAGGAGAAIPAKRYTGDMVRQRYSLFQRQLTVFTEGLARTEGMLYGFGAAQMVPTLAYHMQSDLSFLQCILDDNPDRHDLMYPDLPVRIKKPKEDMDLSGASVVITALDSIRPILGRLIGSRAKEILVPVQSF